MRNIKTYHYPASQTERGVFTLGGNTSVQTWEEQEIIALKTLLSKSIPKNFFSPTTNVLDIGAGTGRLPNIIRVKGKWTLVEPDLSRASQAKKNNVFRKDSVITNFFQNILFPPLSFDVVFCMHLAQHVSEDDWENILKKVRRVIKSNGYFILAFTMKNSLFGTYNIQWQKSGEVIMSEVPKLIFNSIANDRSSEILPIKKIDINEMVQQLTKFSLKVVQYEYYSPIFSSRLQRILRWFISNFSVEQQSILLKKLGYSHYFDCVMVAQKI